MIWALLAARALVVAVLGLVAVLAGSPVVMRVFRRADPPPSKDDTEEVELALGIRAAAAKLRGGRWIDVYKRQIQGGRIEQQQAGLTHAPCSHADRREPAPGHAARLGA